MYTYIYIYIYVRVSQWNMRPRHFFCNFPAFMDSRVLKGAKVAYQKLRIAERKRCVWTKYSALLRKYRALLREYRALLSQCRALLREYRARLLRIRACNQTLQYKYNPTVQFIAYVPSQKTESKSFEWHSNF